MKIRLPRIYKNALLLVITLLVLLLVGGLLYKHYHSPAPKNIPLAGESKPSISSSEGGVVDKNGQINGSPLTQSQWTSSSDGVITLQQPAKNSVLKSGNTISGTTKLNAVQFRLGDNVRGVIAQGQLSVVNGVFSEILNFQSTGTSGRLDVFSLDPNSGAEINEIQIPVLLTN